jgi:hypothetical protein
LYRTGNTPWSGSVVGGVGDGDGGGGGGGQETWESTTSDDSNTCSNGWSSKATFSVPRPWARNPFHGRLSLDRPTRVPRVSEPSQESHHRRLSRAVYSTRVVRVHVPVMPSQRSGRWVMVKAGPIRTPPVERVPWRYSTRTRMVLGRSVPSSLSADARQLNPFLTDLLYAGFIEVAQGRLSRHKDPCRLHHQGLHWHCLAALRCTSSCSPSEPEFRSASDFTAWRYGWQRVFRDERKHLLCPPHVCSRLLL